jgi:hypothetical protein
MSVLQVHSMRPGAGRRACMRAASRQAETCDTSPTGSMASPTTGSGSHRPGARPGDRRLAATVAFAAVEDVDRAVASAVAAFPEWRDAPVTRRQRVMFAYRELLEAHRHDLAKTVTSEHGKTLDDALGEVQRGIEVVEFACGIPHLLKGTSPSRCRPASTPSRSASRSGWWRASRRSTSRPWSRCGCSRWRSPAGTPSSSSRPRRTRRPRCCSPSCSGRRGSPTACSTSCTATGWRWTGSSSTPTSVP